MLKKYFTAAIATALFFGLCNTGCTKLDTTTQGADLLIVDNINTFADSSLLITSTQGVFTNDSSIIRKNENYVIGRIDNDPLFGNTEAAIYVQFKPSFYPFYFGNAGDTVKFGNSQNTSPSAGFDSAFISLSYKGAYGDTTMAGNLPQTFTVRTIIDDDFKNKPDTIRKLNYQPTLGSVIGTATITPADIVKYKSFGRPPFKDSLNNTIRIRIDNGFASAIFNGQDSTTSGPNNAFFNDSIFRAKYNGFAITVSGTGNTLYYVNLAETKTRLEFHYKKVRGAAKDTVVQAFLMYPTSFGTRAASSSNDYVKRTLSPTVTSPSANYRYLQTSPGTFVNLSIPAFTGYTNRIIHRAYIVVEQDATNFTFDDKYTPPPYLYLDLKEKIISTPQIYKPIYFDLSNQTYDPDAINAGASFPLYYPGNNVDPVNFGGAAQKRYDPIANLFYYRYEINITRYVQHIVSNGLNNYDMRLFAPYQLYYPQYVGYQFNLPYFNPIAIGRVRVGSELNAAHKMRLVVIYSKI